MLNLKKLSLVAVAVVMCSVLSQAQLKIDGHIAVLDSLTNTYLCPVSITNFGTNFAAQVTYDETLTDVKIDDTSVASGETFTFAGVAGGKRWSVVASDNGTTVTRDLTFTYLPVMLMNGTFGEEYTSGTIQVLDPDDYTDELMLSKVKWRGASTNLGNRHKRNYHIKFIDEDSNKVDHKFFGLRNDNSWILDAGQIDFLRVRNRVATELWNDMCTKPYYADREPKVKTGVGGQMVEVFLNGKYVGFYAMTEAIDRKLLKLIKYDEETGEIHGQLWKGKSLTSTTSLNIFEQYNDSLPTWRGFETKYPELEEVFPTNYKVLGDAVYNSDTTSTAEFNSWAHLTYDMPVMVDYEIFIQAMLAIDNYAKNIYWFTYDRATEKQVSLAVWDIDTSVGGNWTSAQFHPTTMSPTRSIIFPNGVFGRIARPQSTYYKQGIERYNELRKGVLHTDSLVERYTAAVDYLDKCGAIEREEARWSRNSDLSGRTLDIKGELAYVVDWIKTRMEFLDNTRFKAPIYADVTNDGKVDVDDINTTIDVILSGLGILEDANADVNGDGKVDVADINCIINVILNDGEEVE